MRIQTIQFTEIWGLVLMGIPQPPCSFSPLEQIPLDSTSLQKHYRKINVWKHSSRVRHSDFSSLEWDPASLKLMRMGFKPGCDPYNCCLGLPFHLQKISQPLLTSRNCLFYTNIYFKHGIKDQSRQH